MCQYVICSIIKNNICCTINRTNVMKMAHNTVKEARTIIRGDSYQVMFKVALVELFKVIRHNEEQHRRKVHSMLVAYHFIVKDLNGNFRIEEFEALQNGRDILFGSTDGKPFKDSTTKALVKARMYRHVIALMNELLQGKARQDEREKAIAAFRKELISR